jgi:hypothetical protein
MVCKQWQQKKHERLEVIRQEKAKEEVAPCSFKPKINPRSSDMTSGVAQNHRKVV